MGLGDYRLDFWRLGQGSLGFRGKAPDYPFGSGAGTRGLGVDGHGLETTP